MVEKCILPYRNPPPPVVLGIRCPITWDRHRIELDVVSHNGGPAIYTLTKTEGSGDRPASAEEAKFLSQQLWVDEMRADSYLSFVLGL